MRGEWETRLLGEFLSVKHGWAFPSEEFCDAGDYVVLTPGNFIEGGGLKRRGTKDKHYSADFPLRYMLTEGDILVVMTDLMQAAPLLGGALVIPEDSRFLHNQRLGLIQTKDKRAIHRGFLYYLLNSEEYKAQVRASATGATVRHTAPSRIEKCRVRLPVDLDEQAAIAEILGAHDELITNTSQQIVLLEEAAHLIYTEWFAWLRYVGHEQIGRIAGSPCGWESVPLAEAVFINPKTPFDADKEAPFVPMTALSEQGMVIEGVERRMIGGGAKFQNGDTLLARITPCLENGKTGFVQFLDEDEPVASGSTEFIVLRSRRVNPYWIYCLARTDHFREFAIRSMSGADGRQRVSTESLAQYPVLLPSESVLADFSRIVGPMFEQIHILTKQSAELRQARDLLLPRLISGQLRL